MNYNGEERQFQASGLSFAARQWGSSDGQPVLALHGWQDNAASFDLLAPMLNSVNLVALDLAGHGLTSHRSEDASYNIWEDVLEITAIADQLEWDQFTLLGHSRGAIISVITAGTLPERIDKLALIDGFGPACVEPEDAPVQLAKAITDELKHKYRKLRYYPTLEEATKSRTNSFSPLSYEAAVLLASRGVAHCDQGYYWRADRRLQVNSELKLSHAHFDAFVKGIQAPALLCLADKGALKGYPAFASSLQHCAQLQEQVFAGDHHLHMEEPAAKVAEAINEFLR